MSTLHRSTRTARGLAALALVAALATLASAQEKGPEIHPQDQAQQQLVELFNKVETRLREIDKLLSDAGAGDTRALKDVGPSGIDELLKQSKKSGEEALQDIDRILEIARQMQQQSKSQGQGQPQQQPGQGDGKDPLEGQSQTTQQREQTPSKPEKQDKQPGGKKPEGEKGQEKGKDKPEKKPDGESNPNDPKGSKQPAKNQQSGPPPGSPTDKSGANADSHDRWGDLPQRARDVFRSEGGHDMPVQYRDWIDAYYRRLNQKQP